ncbi:tetratricopeptide repeat protein [Streptomyces griseoaurantiacus]|uniref:Tetratricopeptide repeat protein n=1 Tax=Streptomyces griseoaurantiacus TaxID=68213 RepID=A0A7W2DX06_9ACTN|nr:MULTISPECIES: tetratricopeptide repeat protein [Streptomyces]MBA5224548.1 tetratricopeptide repeat protein [Streptomyces griseoaurantiacus]
MGRHGEMNAFRENLSRDPEGDDYQFFFHVRGNAGVGKTSLLRQWEMVAREQGAATVYLDDGVHSAVEAMAEIGDRLSFQGLPLRRFGKLLATFRQRVHEAQSAPDGQTAAEASAAAEPSAASLPASVAAQVGLVGLGMVPVVGAFAGAVDPQQIVQGADRLRSVLGARLRSHDDVRLVVDPVRVLTPVFLEDLAEAALRRPWMVLFFDVYERTGPVLDEWLRDIVFGEIYGALSVNVQVVLSGQGRLAARSWSDWLDLVTEVPLEVFTEEEARALLALRGVTDERVVEVVLRLSGRLPVLVHTLAQARPDSDHTVGDPSGTAVERFLKWETDPARRAAALALALPLQFDEDVYRVVAPPEAVEQFAWVRRLAFVTDQAGRCRYHDVVRASMLRLQRQQSPTRWRAAHEALAETFRTWRTKREATLSSSDRWSDAAWREHRYNETYHRLCAAPRSALSNALTETVHACEHGSATARRWAQLFAQAGTDTADDTLMLWGERLTDATRDDTAPVLTIFDVLLAHSGMETVGQLQARVARGRLHRRAERNEAALADLTAALALDPRHDDALVERAFTHQQMGNAADALADLDEAIRICPDAWTHVVRGHANLEAGQRGAALADFDRALELDPEQEWARASRAEIHRVEGRYEVALADLDCALAIDPEYTWARAERSWCLIGLERWEEALDEMARAADLDSATHWYRVHFARLLLDLGQHAEAFQQVDRALAASNEHGPRGHAWPYSVRAWALHGLGRDTEALADLDHAIACDGGDRRSFAMRGWLLWEAGRLEEAEQDFDRSLADGQQWPWALGGRGAVRLYAQRYEEAVDDFARAFIRQFGMADAENEAARPLVELLREHLPTNRAPITATIRLVGLYTVQVKWPGVARQTASVLALRPSFGLLTGGSRILRRVAAALDDPSQAVDIKKTTWARKLVTSILHVLDPWRSSTNRKPG